MERNADQIKLFREIADKIEDHPELYDQADYEAQKDCGTAHCIGGWACELRRDDLQWITNSYYGQEDVSPLAGFFEAGSNLLGLTGKETMILFDAGWTPREGLTVPAALRAIADGAEIADVTDTDFMAEVVRL